MTQYVAGAWWDAFAEAGGLPDLETWLGGVDAESRVRLRQRVAECGYQTVLDCGAGLGLDYISMTNNKGITYSGIEPSAPMIDAANRILFSYGHGGDDLPIIQGSILDIPYPDANFDFVYCRHVLEHLSRFEEALHEMIRVALLEVAVVFFMRPGAHPYLLRERDGLWHNRYAKHDIETFLNREAKVECFFWEHLHESEVILHVYLENTLEVDLARVAERVAQEPDAE